LQKVLGPFGAWSRRSASGHSKSYDFPIRPSPGRNPPKDDLSIRAIEGVTLAILLRPSESISPLV
jgi:hypothetical protein